MEEMKLATLRSVIGCLSFIESSLANQRMSGNERLRRRQSI